jgi:hypothetical protein
VVVPLAVTCDAQDSRLGFFFLPQIPDFENESLARARRGKLPWSLDSVYTGVVHCNTRATVFYMSI